MILNSYTEGSKLLKCILTSQYLAVLNSLSEGLPYSNLVSFATTDDLKSLVFTTDRNTRKYRNIRENNNISLLIDNRANQPSDLDRAIAITVIGIAQEVLMNNSSLQAIFLHRHPQLKGFVGQLNTALVLITVREYIIAGFNKMQRVTVDSI